MKEQSITNNKLSMKIAVTILVSIIFLILSPFIGIDFITISDILNKDTTESFIFYNTRLPRVLVSFAVGGILSVSGLVFQSIFKNPIATPYTLGVASGASLGAAIYFFIGISFFSSFIGSTLAAMVGAIAVIFVVYMLSLSSGKMNNNSILLAGVAISFFCSAIIMFIQYFADLSNSYQITRFMMGSIAGVSMKNAYYILPLSLIFILLVFTFNKELDIISTGNNIAESRGVNVKFTISFLYFIVSLSLAAVIAITGPIGFVGMMVPHISRLLISSRNKILIPISFIVGGAFLTFCDMISRTIIAPSELPVAVITSLLGAPFFIFLIVSGRKI